jgi:hypothetical protein
VTTFWAHTTCINMSIDYSQTMRDREVAATARRQLYSFDRCKCGKTKFLEGTGIKLNVNLNTKHSDTL